MYLAPYNMELPIPTAGRSSIEYTSKKFACGCGCGGISVPYPTLMTIAISAYRKRQIHDTSLTMFLQAAAKGLV
jgi:hypothetical protein